MSLNRLIYYSAIIGAWAAVVGCLLAEFFIRRTGWLGEDTLRFVASAALVGACIGGGLNLVSGMANARWLQQVKRLVPGFLVGAAAGALGGWVGNLVFNSLGWPRALGWLVMGLGLGVAEGLCELSWAKVRNGLLGGGTGGLLGGFLFDPVQKLAESGTGMASRAIAYVVLGLCIGALIGLVQVVLKEAWLKVVDGYRPGRELILSKEVTALGKAEYVALPFLGAWSKNLEPIHVRVLRQPNGQYAVEDNQTPAGTRLNGAPLQGRKVLRDGDVIQFGSNSVRFRERQRAAGSEPATRSAASSVPAASARPAVPVPILAPPAPVQPSVPGEPLPAAQAGVTRQPDQCPKCGRKVPGPPGRRRCMIDGTTF